MSDYENHPMAEQFDTLFGSMGAMLHNFVQQGRAGGDTPREAVGEARSGILHALVLLFGKDTMGDTIENILMGEAIGELIGQLENAENN